ncbi:MAG: ABC transporter substrate-binding protein [Actinobacteria bacterium]|nr:ABC transporter substrate-binding protein [Actinomycetota bacterium]
MGFSRYATAASQRKAISFLLVALALLAPLVLVPGCSGTSGTGSDLDPATSHVVTDSVGREVRVPNDPQGIAALDSFCGEALVMIGAGPRLSSLQGGTASSILLQQVYPEMVDLPQAMASGSINIETLLDSNTDVVVIQEAVYSSKDEMTKLDKLDIPYVVVGYSDIDEQIAAISLLGDVSGGEAQVKAKALCQYYRDTVTLCEQHAALIPDDRKVQVYHSDTVLTVTDGKLSLGSDWVTRVGAVNVSGEQEMSEGERDYQASLEQIYIWNPDVVVCNAVDVVDYLKTDSKWTGLRAVEDGALYNIPVGATRWGQRGSVETYLAMLWLGVTIYPEQYSDIDFKQTVIDYYKEYLGIEVGDELYEKMLSGTGLRDEGGIGNAGSEDSLGSQGQGTGAGSSESSAQNNGSEQKVA